MARAYDNSSRQEKARRTRSHIVATARRLLLDGGYPAMTVASLAAEAAVSPQTVYNAIGGKADVVKAVYDAMMAGDDAHIAMSDRPQFRAMFEAADRPAFARAYAAWVRMLSGRVGPLLGALQAHGADAAVTHLMGVIDQERYTGTTHAMTGLRDRIGLPSRWGGRRGLGRLIDAAWTLNSPEVYDRLVRRRQWTPTAYERWLADQFAALIAD